MRERRFRLPWLQSGRPAKYSRDTHRFLPGLALQKRALQALHIAVIGGYENDRIVALPDLVQLFEQAADLLVEARHGGIVACDRLPGSVLFRAGLPILSKLDLLRVVHRLEARWRNVWIMRRGRLPVQAERPSSLTRLF